MNPIQKIAIEKALSFLKAGNLSFAIVDDEGNKWGDLEVVMKKQRVRSANKYPRGTVRDYYYDLVKDMKKDDGVAIPFGEFKPIDLQSNICAWAATNWGSGCYSTSIDKQNKSVILFRIG